MNNLSAALAAIVIILLALLFLSTVPYAAWMIAGGLVGLMADHLNTPTHGFFRVGVTLLVIGLCGFRFHGSAKTKGDKRLS